ncbi:class I SAM-dependent methyltransferase [Cellulomonas fimi]|uniref:class I SAM-dependent methyltransferase n=1 Tax=Cellulomonas fimi TaxID=1708 RepID=UPI00234C05FB|nr:class I SAM-dependent methyltransferase [Cellulomonas fimi]MDC7120578.1 class I SAM-dependent methyltransferase [Cellulomonas fimi]
MWDKAAPAYDKQIAFYERIWFTGGRQWIGARSRGRVLEVAVGTGRNLSFYPRETTITGLDLSPAMLALAARRASELGRVIDLHEGDAAHLPFDGATFDTAVCALSLCSIPDPQRAISEMHRVLVPGGTLLLLDHVASTWPPLHGAQWVVEQATRRLAGEFQTRRQRPLVEATGFTIAEADRLKAGTVERLRAIKP